MAKIYGTEDKDTLYGTVSADVIWGYGGNDYVSAGNSNDRIHGGEGDDLVYGGAGSDVLHGDAGDDTLVGDDGDDRLYGGTGSDYLWGAGGHDELYGGGGVDQLVDSDGGDLLDGGGGVDTLSISLINYAATSFVFDPAGPLTTPFGSTAVNFEQINITGSTGYDSLTGADRNDLLRGWDGNDVLFGLGGADFLIGDNGDDILWGDAGDDRLDGGGNFDTLHGGAGDDILAGGSTSDVFPSDDFLDGGPGADTFLLGGFHLTTIDYSSSKTGVFVDLQQNLAYGGDAQGDSFGGSSYGRVKFQGSAFNDAFVGGEQQYGGDGADRLVAGADTELMSGGSGKDTFAFRFDPGVLYDTPLVLDFDQAAHEVLDVSALDARPASGSQAFTFIDTAEFSGSPGELRYQIDAGRTVIQMQCDHDPEIEASIVLQGEYTLLATDFWL